MYGKSPMMKALIGKQGNLPVDLQKEILAAPTKMYGKSPMKNDKEKKIKTLKGTTVFGHEVSKIKNKVANKAKKLGRKVELVFDSGIYSNKYKAENPGRFKSDKINQPRFKAEKKKLLKK